LGPVRHPGAAAGYLAIADAAHRRERELHAGLEPGLGTGLDHDLAALQRLERELSFDYHERARIFSVTHGFAIVGTILGILIPGFIQISGGTRVTALATVAWLILIMLPLSSLGLLFRVPEQSSHYVPVGWNQSFKILRKNEPLRRLLLAYLLNGVANGLPASLFLLFVQSVIGGSESRAGILLLCYFGAGLAGLPIWLMLARRLGKHQVWCLGMLMACLAFIWVPWLGPGDFRQFLLICLFSGLTLGADLALPAAIQADVIDEDTVHSGSSQAGLYLRYGAWRPSSLWPWRWGSLIPCWAGSGSRAKADRAMPASMCSAGSMAGCRC